MSEHTSTPAIAPREIHSIASHVALLLLSAVLLALAFPRPGWGFLAHVALVPMTILALRAASARRLLWIGYLVSWAWWLIMIRWMIGVTFGGWIALAGYMALYMPLGLFLVRLLHRRLRLPVTLALPLVWVSLEYVRCHGLEGGFAWFALGHSQGPVSEYHSNSPSLIQVADLLGQHGVSFLVAMTNGLAVDLLTRPLMQRREGKKRPGAVMAMAVALWGAAMLGAVGYGQYRLRETTVVEKGAATLRIAVVQTSVPQSNKERGSDEQRDTDWQRMLDLTVLAASAPPKPDLIVWPETMVPASLNREALEYQDPESNNHRVIAAFAEMHGIAMLVGADAWLDWRPYMKNDTEYVGPTRRYNSAYLYRADGEQDHQRYDKMHRVPFGEYIPWTEGRPALKKLFFKYLSPYGDFDYSINAGDKVVAFELRARGDASRYVRFATPICFEDAMPHVCREMIYDDAGNKRADVLINLTNDGWFAGTDQPWQQLQIAAFRCVENRVPMARSVNTGVSGFINATGRITRLVNVNGRSVDVEGWATEDLRTDPRRTLFGRIGHTPIHGMMVVTVGLCLFAATRKRRA